MFWFDSTFPPAANKIKVSIFLKGILFLYKLKQYSFAKWAKTLKPTKPKPLILIFFFNYFFQKVIIKYT